MIQTNQQGRLNQPLCPAEGESTGVGGNKNKTEHTKISSHIATGPDYNYIHSIASFVKDLLSKKQDGCHSTSPNNNK